jgi:hypothetical protein
MSSTQTPQAKREYCLQRAVTYDRFAERHPARADYYRKWADQYRKWADEWRSQTRGNQ